MESVSASVANVFGNLNAWIQTPFMQTLNIRTLALLIPIVIVLTVFWIMILKDIKGDI